MLIIFIENLTYGAQSPSFLRKGFRMGKIRGIFSMYPFGICFKIGKRASTNELIFDFFHIIY